MGSMQEPRNYLNGKRDCYRTDNVGASFKKIKIMKLPKSDWKTDLLFLGMVITVLIMFILFYKIGIQQGKIECINQNLNL